MKTPYLPGGLSRRIVVLSLAINGFFVFALPRHQTQNKKTVEVNKGRRVLMEARRDTDERMEATIGLLLMDHAEWLQREPRTTQEVLSRFGVPMLLPESSDDLPVQRISNALFDAGYTPVPKIQGDPRWYWEGWPPTAAPTLVVIVPTVYSSWVILKCPVYQPPIDDALQVQRVERGLFISAKRPPYTEPGGSCRRGRGMEYKGTDNKSLGYRKEMESGSSTDTQHDSWVGGHA